jgi:uncharacterized membrane protein YbjE (DUF340 family)
MATLSSLAIIFLFLIAGMLAARLRLVPLTGLLDRVMTGVLALLLFSMGLRIGLMEGVEEKLMRIGALSLGMAAATIAGTALVLSGVLLLTGVHRRSAHTQDSGGGGAGAAMAEPLRLLAVVVAGFFVGFVIPEAFGWFRDRFTTWILYVLLFLIGIQLVRSEVDLKRMLLNPAVLIVPVGTAVGSLAGGALLAAPFDLTAGKAASLAAGFGWYSLSGVIIADLGSPLLGAAGFLTNMIRETIALLTIPLLARMGAPHVAIGIAGATSMDVTLPLVERSCGPQYVPLSIASGALLSLSVPFLVPFFYGLGA